MNSHLSIQLAGTSRKCPLHACAFFASKEEEYRVLLPFVKEGIEAGDKCVIIIDKAHRDETLERFAGTGVDVATVERTGQLELRPWEQAHVCGGHFDQHAMLAALDEEAASGRRERGITRVWSNQEWALEGLPGCQNLIEYESRFNDIWPKYNDVFVCVYDTTKFRADTITNILRTHPFAIVGGILRENPFYVPPRELLEELRGLSAVPKMPERAGSNDAEGVAALSICESLLLALNDLKIVSEEDTRDLLTDVATTHQEAAVSSLSPDRHQAVVTIVRRMLAARNGLRH